MFLRHIKALKIQSVIVRLKVSKAYNNNFDVLLSFIGIEFYFNHLNMKYKKQN